jgi:phage shock protein E
MFNSFSSTDACKLLANGAQLIDVRTTAEFSRGALPNAISLPLQGIINAANIIDKNKAIILYCLSGARSATAKNYLTQMGFTEVHDLGAFKNYTCE